MDTILDKKQMTEEDIKLHYITPAIQASGDGFQEYDFLTGEERTLPLDGFPSPEELTKPMKLEHLAPAVDWWNHMNKLNQSWKAPEIRRILQPIPQWYRLTGASEKALLSSRANRNVRNMRQFYLAFPNCYALRSNLSWTHYRMLMRVENEKARNFYLEECEKANWSTREGAADPGEEDQAGKESFHHLLGSR